MFSNVYMQQIVALIQNNKKSLLKLYYDIAIIEFYF